MKLKIKLPQILGGISAATFLLSNFLYLVNHIVLGWGMAVQGGLDFWLWPLGFVIQFSATLIFTILYKNNLLRYLAFGIFLLFSLIKSIYWMKNYDGSLSYAGLLFIKWPPSWGYANGPLMAVASTLSFISFVVLVVAVIVSFFYSTQKAENTTGLVGNTSSLMINHVSQPQSKRAQGQFSEIEVLGDLLAKGLLTQEEFDRKKREILGFNQ